MQQLNNHDFRHCLLRTVYKIAPFDLKGDLKVELSHSVQQTISCLIITSKRPKELDLLLEDLADQTLNKERFEVIILNDGGGKVIQEVVEKYRPILQIVYRENGDPHRIISDLRNMTVEMSEGKYILFLDDDTRILQKDFLAKSLDLLDQTQADIVLVQGKPLYGLVKQRYCHLDQYSFANRCCLCQRKALENIGGFKAHLHSYEDIELSIRLIIYGFQIFKTDELTYFHPPFYFDSLRKPLSIGQTVFQIRHHYSFLVWLLVYLNALRFLPFGLIPKKSYQQWFRISLGVLLYPFVRKAYYY